MDEEEKKNLQMEKPIESRIKLYQLAEVEIKKQFLPKSFDYDCKFDLQKVVQDKLVADNTIKDNSEY